MIEVEGKINDQPIAILIDLGASHSYIDPKMVERFHFPRRKLGKVSARSSWPKTWQANQQESALA
jgi:hypothetical protein